MISVTSSPATEWRATRHVPSWEFCLLSGTSGKPLGGPFTIYCRCKAGTVYRVWVSDGLTEYYMISGSLRVKNEVLDTNVVLATGDYASVPPGDDQLLSSDDGMVALCIIPGRFLYAGDVYEAISANALTHDDVKAVLHHPWIEHLTRNCAPAVAEISKAAVRSETAEWSRALSFLILQSIREPNCIDTARLLVKQHIGALARIGCLTYLNSVGEMPPGAWPEQAKILKSHPEETVEAARCLYGASDDASLMRMLEEQAGRAKSDHDSILCRELIDVVQRVRQ
jgi:hypothetical protein